MSSGLKIISADERMKEKRGHKITNANNSTKAGQTLVYNDSADASSCLHSPGHHIHCKRDNLRQ